MLKSRTSNAKEFPCAVAECSKKSLRKGGYCADHHNSLKLGASSKPESKLDKCMHACTGNVKNGECERHRNQAPVYVPSPTQKTVSRRNRRGRKPRRQSDADAESVDNDQLSELPSSSSTGGPGAAPRGSPLESVSEDEEEQGGQGRGSRSSSTERRGGNERKRDSISSHGSRTSRSSFSASGAAATGGASGSLAAAAPRRRSIMQLATHPEKQEEIVQTFLDAIYSISKEIEPDKAAAKIIEQSCKLLKAERATLFYVDGEELILMIAKGARNIRLPKKKGVAGHVASTGESYLVPDAYTDPKFDSSFDKQSGFRTRNILAVPIKDDHSVTIAVLQMINKEIGEFTENDKTLAEHIASHCSVVLRNAQLYETAVRAEQKVLSLVEIVTMLHSDPTPSSLVFTLTHQNVVEADRCSLYLVDDTRGELIVMQGDLDMRIPLSSGIAGFVANNGKAVNIPDCYKDPRFNQEVDHKSGYHTKSMLCMPIFSGRKVIGVLQLMNKKDDTQFNEADQRILTTLLNIAGPILERSPLFTSSKKRSGVQQLDATRSDLALPRRIGANDLEGNFKSLAEEYEETE